MKRTTMIWLCLITVLAMSATVANSASAALPEFIVCAKAQPKNTGAWKDKECSEVSPGGVGKWERVAWNNAKKRDFKGKDAAIATTIIINPLVTPAENRGTIECTKEDVAGEVTGPKQEKWRTTWTGCNLAKAPCTTPGARRRGEIKSEELEGTLVYLDKAKTKVGMLVKGTTGKIAKYECAGIASIEQYQLGGYLVERTGDINKASKDYAITATSGPLNLQQPIYEEELGTEAQGKEALIWLVCVNETQRTTGKTRLESEAACTVALGAPVMPVFSMISLVVQPGVGIFTLPASQRSVTADKGEEFLVAA